MRHFPGKRKVAPPRDDERGEVVVPVRVPNVRDLKTALAQERGDARAHTGFAGTVQDLHADHVAAAPPRPRVAPAERRPRPRHRDPEHADREAAQPEAPRAVTAPGHAALPCREPEPA